MTEKRYEYCRSKYRHYIQDIEKDGAWKEGRRGTYGEFDLDKITERLNKFDSENKRLKIKNKGLQSELQIFKENVEYNNKICNKLSEENEQLKDALNQRTDQCDKYYKKNEQLKHEVNYLQDRLDDYVLVEKENKELKAKVDDKEVAVEVECEKLMQRVFDLIDEKIKLYSHKPVSAPISQPMSVNFDADMDRLARLSELQDLKEELQE